MVAKAGMTPLELNALLGVSPLLNPPPRRSPRLAKRELEPSPAEYPLFTSYAALVPAALERQKPLEGMPPAEFGAPFDVKITRRRTNVAKVPWDPDDFQLKRQQTWAPPMPRRRLMDERRMPAAGQQKKTLMGGGSFKQRVDSERAGASPHVSPAVGAKEEVAAERSHESSPLCAVGHALKNKPAKTSIVHTDPTHKRDVHIRGSAFGWGAR